jgi:hypothetical protein
MEASRLRVVRDLAFVLDRVVAPERLAYEQIAGKHPLLPAGPLRDHQHEEVAVGRRLQVRPVLGQSGNRARWS